MIPGSGFGFVVPPFSPLEYGHILCTLITPIDESHCAWNTACGKVALLSNVDGAR